MPTTTSDASGSAGESELLNQDTFMMLLLEQLKHQDPLNPMDNQQMVEQLATLTSLQELQDVNTNLETIQMFESSLNNAQSVSLIGKYVKALGSTVTLDDTGSASVPFYLASDAATVTVEIRDESGDTVKTIQVENCSEGDNEVVWDGTNLDGTEMTPGNYDFVITAEDSEGNAVQADTFFEGIVTSVRFEGGVPIVVIDGHEVSVGDIYEINLTDPDQDNV
jgi:flagellar basal-body rod modification protein FlgD